MAETYDRTAACAQLYSTLKASPGWSWMEEGTWRKAPNTSGPLWFYVMLRAVGSAYEWEFRSYEDDSLITGGSSADVRAAFRAVKVGPLEATIPLKET
jgi:hypothetical protein